MWDVELEAGDEGCFCDAVVCRLIPVRCPAAALCHAGDVTTMDK